nr:hypothetical protein [Bradyrhizobium sp. BR13661]
MLKKKTLVNPLFDINRAAIIYPTHERSRDLFAIVSHHRLRLPLHEHYRILFQKFLEHLHSHTIAEQWSDDIRASYT